MAVIGLVLSLFLSQTEPLPGLARGFFTSIKHKQYETAYFLMSKEYKSKSNVNNFRQEIMSTDLQHAKEWKTLEHKTDNKSKTGWITGFVTVTVDNKNKRIPVEIEAKIEEGGFLETSWKITNIRLEHSER